MKLTVIGCGDAFGAGGRLQTSYLVDLPGQRLLLDCGASITIGLNRLGIDADSIAAIVISHLHGDHFAGLIWMALHAQYVTRRTAPLTVIGPPGIEQRYLTAAEALYPGFTSQRRRYALEFQEIAAGTTRAAGPARITAYEVSHPSGAPSHAVRIEAGGRTLAFSGDTEWVDVLAECSRDADLFIVECYGYDKPVPYHMSWSTIRPNLPRLSARRVMLTHMNGDMLANAHQVNEPRVFLAEDGLVVDV